MIRFLLDLGFFRDVYRYPVLGQNHKRRGITRAIKNEEIEKMKGGWRGGCICQYREGVGAVRDVHIY